MPIPRKLSTGLVVTAVCLAATPLPRVAGSEPRFPRYRITGLGHLPGKNSTFPTALNNRGQVVGYTYTHVPPGHGNSMLASPFLWENGRMRALKTLGGEFGRAYGINDAGDVVGGAEDRKGVGRPVIWKRSRGYQPEALSAEPGYAMCIDARGVIAGLAGSPVLWKGGKPQALSAPNADNVRFTGMSPGGEIIGHTWTSGRYFSGEGERAYRWRDGKPEPLPTLGGKRSLAAGISPGGLIVGWSDDEKGKSQATTWSEGKPSLLHGLDEDGGSAAAINRHGVIVGESGKASLWLNGEPKHLEELVSNRGEWRLWRAEAINDRGQIAGTGRARENGITDAFLLTPL